MAQGYTNLEIYKDSESLFVKVGQIVAHMNKAYKFTAGAKASELAVENTVDILQISRTKDKDNRIAFLNNIILNTERLKIYLRLFHESKNLDSKHFSNLTLLSSKIQEQATKWERSMINK